MKITYKVNNENYNIFYKKNIDNEINKEIEKVSSDKKIILIYDQSISNKIVDSLILRLKESGCSISSYKFQGNKKNKSEKTLLSLIDLMIEKKLTKKSILISFGGGVLGDVTALAASLYLRGLIYFHIPSTMTAIIDSCIGGKTAINYKNIINSIGNYYHSKNVFIYHNVIEELPVREFLSGISEIIKCGIIKKNKILNILKKNKDKILKRDFIVLQKLCLETLNTKIFFFKNDIYEKNIRLFLNFGHTFAHALEMATQKIENKEVYRHGEAVGIGMLCELYLANRKKNKNYFLVKNLLNEFNLPTKIKSNKKSKLIDEMYKNVFLDKKKVNKLPRYIKIIRLFKPKISEIENTSIIPEAIKENF
jgi:3-dehydroquinate synthase